LAVQKNDDFDVTFSVLVAVEMHASSVSLVKYFGKRFLHVVVCEVEENRSGVLKVSFRRATNLCHQTLADELHD